MLLTEHLENAALLKGTTMRNHIYFDRAPQTNTSTLFALISLFPERSNVSSKMDPVASFLLVKRIYTLLGNYRKQDAPVFAEQLGLYFPSMGKLKGHFCFSLGNLGPAEEGANTEISHRMQMLGFFQHFSPE